MRFPAIRIARIQAARSLLFGAHAGLPGERWLARPLVAKDMLNWYFPSKYGLQEFRLSEYFQMQAERYRKRPEPQWVRLWPEVMQTIAANCERIEKHLNALSAEELGKNQTALDLKEMVENMSRMQHTMDKVLAGNSTVHAKLDSKPDSAVENKKRLFVNTRHRFIDPLFRRRRLKWMERFLAGMNNAKEIKYNKHFTRHPDKQKHWPTNVGSVTVKWPNRRN